MLDSDHTFSSKDMFQKTFDFSGIGMALIDLSGTWMHVNHRLCEIQGYREEELRVRTF